MKKVFLVFTFISLIYSFVYGQSIQQRLNNGETPYQIYYNNPGLLDSLYGKTYGGGLIFYEDTTNGNALISAKMDQSAGNKWGCLSTWLNTSDSLFGGYNNTVSIVKTCGGNAATICDTLTLNGYDNWYLPDKAECNLMYKNLKQKGYGHFDYSSWKINYWTSNQGAGSSFSTAIRFWDALTTNYTRTTMNRIRAIRKSTVLIFKGLKTGKVGSFSENGFTLSTYFNGKMPFGNIYTDNYGLKAPAMAVGTSRTDIDLYLMKNDGSNFGVSSIMIRTINSTVSAQKIEIVGLLGNNHWVEYRNTIPKGAKFVKCILPDTFRNIHALQWNSGLILSTKIELME